MYKRSLRNAFSQSHWQEMQDACEAYRDKADMYVDAFKKQYGDDPELFKLVNTMVGYITACSSLAGACMQMSGVNVLEIVSDKVQ